MLALSISVYKFTTSRFENFNIFPKEFAKTLRSTSRKHGQNFDQIFLTFLLTMI